MASCRRETGDWGCKISLRVTVRRFCCEAVNTRWPFVSRWVLRAILKTAKTTTGQKNTRPQNGHILDTGHFQLIFISLGQVSRGVFWLKEENEYLFYVIRDFGPMKTGWSGCKLLILKGSGAPDRIRTCDPRLRRAKIIGMSVSFLVGVNRSCSCLRFF